MQENEDFRNKNKTVARFYCVPHNLSIYYLCMQMCIQECLLGVHQFFGGGEPSGEAQLYGGEIHKIFPSHGKGFLVEFSGCGVYFLGVEFFSFRLFRDVGVPANNETLVGCPGEQMAVSHGAIYGRKCRRNEVDRVQFIAPTGMTCSYGIVMRQRILLHFTVFLRNQFVFGSP